ncbi:MAG: non-canonical purine NTP pyrophosphatase [Phycisphaeraceae bacterium]|nr:MAG: non-canonical purine NTP pyrophosphatase [Phycisphaeraceae bacterium]
MPTIVLGTGNPHKVEEVRAIFASEGLGGVSVISLAEACPGRAVPEPEETGSTFEVNATIKALAYARAAGMAALADDSGLEVDALGGRPGVISSHYCTGGREAGMGRAERDAANNARVMRELSGVPAEGRGARFVCVMVLASPAGVLAVSRGVFEGRIGVPGGVPGGVPRGVNGFGYDPLFLVGPEHRVTSAELAAGEKNRLSHRGAAARSMAAQIRALCPAALGVR